jgi:acyl-CoA dehydrogenase
MSDLDAFRAEVRSWLEANCPAEMREPIREEGDVCWGGRNWTFKNDAQKSWLEACVAKGYTVPDWPKPYSGAGLTPEQTKILKQEMKRINARSPLDSFGIWMLGPALLQFGTEEQKVQYLNPIARGEIRWCQGYSEPGSGSDLVSLQTFGEDKGDHWVVNGSKIWTSYADKADWIFCLVRTDKANKYQGITFMLFDMASKGVTTKPILLISGNSPFCETFFDDVEVPKTQIHRRDQPRLGRRQISARPRTRDDLGRRRGRRHGQHRRRIREGDRQE